MNKVRRVHARCFHFGDILEVMCEKHGSELEHA